MKRDGGIVYISTCSVFARRRPTSEVGFFGEKNRKLGKEQKNKATEGKLSHFYDYLTANCTISPDELLSGLFIIYIYFASPDMASVSWRANMTPIK